MASSEARRYDLLKGIQEGKGPTMMSAHGGRGVGAFGKKVEFDTVARLLHETQPAALTGRNDEGSFGYAKLQQKYIDIRNDENSPPSINLQRDIDKGRYAVGTAAHYAAALIKSQPSTHAYTSALPTMSRGEDPKALWIETIAVLPNAVSKGIGSALLHGVIRDYPDEAEIVCEVEGPFEDNPVANWLENELGFELDHQQTRIMWDDTVGVSFYIADSIGLVRKTLEDAGKFEPITQAVGA